MRLAVPSAEIQMRSRTSPLISVMRSPKRVSVTVPDTVMQRLLTHADQQGRSTSNLAAYLLEVALDAMDGKAPIQKRWTGSSQ